MKIYFEEEYGYIQRMWYYPHDKARLIQDFYAGNMPAVPFDSGITKAPLYAGVVKNITRKQARWLHNKGDGKLLHRVDAFIHVHEKDDTMLKFTDNTQHRWLDLHE